MGTWSADAKAFSRPSHLQGKSPGNEVVRNIHPDHNSSTMSTRAPSARLLHLVGRDASKTQRRIENNQVVSIIIHHKLCFLVTIYRESLYISVALVSLKRNCGRRKNSKRSEQVHAVSFLRSRNCVDSGEKSVTSQIGKWFCWVLPVNWGVHSDTIETSFSLLVSPTVIMKA